MPNSWEATGITIGPLQLTGRALLAPMAGVTDAGMRTVAATHGASLTFSEMVAAAGFAHGDEQARARARLPNGGLAGVQLAGCDPVALAEAARLVEGEGAALIDINMGCPAKRVTGGLAGSALMRDLDHAVRLVVAVVGAVRVPVTLKMRLGWDATSLNASQLAARAEQAGVALVTVHGRTRAQFYTGTADWRAVASVKRALRHIPLVVNGDCHSAADAAAMLQQSGADGVMIGRAAMGRPWLVGQVAASLRTGSAAPAPSARERLTSAASHLESLLTQLGVEKGLRHARKHLAAYVEHAGPASSRRSETRRRIVSTDKPREAAWLLREAFLDCEADPSVDPAHLVEAAA